MNAFGRNSTTYGYGTDGLLTDVSHSDGRARHYTYVGDLLTWVRDETGRVLIHNWYRDWKVVRQDYSNGLGPTELWETFNDRYWSAP